MPVRLATIRAPATRASAMPLARRRVAPAGPASSPPARSRATADPRFGSESAFEDVGQEAHVLQQAAPIGRSRSIRSQSFDGASSPPSRIGNGSPESLNSRDLIVVNCALSEVFQNRDPV